MDDTSSWVRFIIPPDERIAIANSQGVGAGGEGDGSSGGGSGGGGGGGGGGGRRDEQGNSRETRPSDSVVGRFVIESIHPPVNTTDTMEESGTRTGHGSAGHGSINKGRGEAGGLSGIKVMGVGDVTCGWSRPEEAGGDGRGGEALGTSRGIVPIGDGTETHIDLERGVGGCGFVTQWYVPV